MIVFVSVMVLAGCARRSPEPSRVLRHPTVASLVPAATDLLLAMGAGDHLAAVSNFEPPRPAIAGLPKVGDYQSTDWEKLTELRPDVMLVFMSPAQMPPGLLQRADTLHIRVMNLKTDTLADIFATIDQLGAAVQAPGSAQTLSDDLHRQLDAVRQRAQGQPPIRAILSLSDDRFDLVGHGSYLDELLSIAGGENVLPPASMAYPTLDRERLVELSPQVVIQLAPDATADWRARADDLWRSVPSLPAVKQQRVATITDAYALQPGAHIGEIARALFDALHR